MSAGASVARFGMKRGAPHVPGLLLLQRLLQSFGVRVHPISRLPSEFGAHQWRNETLDREVLTRRGRRAQPLRNVRRPRIRWNHRQGQRAFDSTLPAGLTVFETMPGQ